MSLARSSHSAPVFQAAAELATLMDENVTLRANDAQLLQPTLAAVPSSTSRGSAVNDAESIKPRLSAPAMLPVVLLFGVAAVCTAVDVGALDIGSSSVSGAFRWAWSTSVLSFVCLLSTAVASLETSAHDVVK